MGIEAYTYLGVNVNMTAKIYVLYAYEYQMAMYDAFIASRVCIICIDSVISNFLLKYVVFS